MVSCPAISDPLLKCHDGVIAGAIGIDHQRVVGGAPCWRCNRTHEAPGRNVAPYQRQRRQHYTQSLHGGRKLEVYVIELGMTGSSQVRHTGLPKPVRPCCARTRGMQQGLMPQICHVLYGALAQQCGAAGGQTQVGHQRARHDAGSLFGSGANPDVEGSPI